MKGSEFKEQITKLKSEIKRFENYFADEAYKKQQVDKADKAVRDYNNSISGLVVGQNWPGDGSQYVTEDDVKKREYGPRYVQPKDFDRFKEGLDQRQEKLKALEAQLQEELKTAMVAGNTDRMVELLDAGADPNTIYSTKKESLLIRAVRDENAPLIDALLASPGLNVNSAHAAIGTALHQAVLKGDVGLVQKLMLNGANIHIKDSNEKTAQDLIKDNPAMTKLFATYEAVEKDFKETLENRVVSELSDRARITNKMIIDNVAGVLAELYDLKGSEKAIAEKVGALKLNFVEEFFTITLPALFKSLAPGADTFLEIETQMRTAVYAKIMDTPLFKELAAPNVGKVTDVVSKEMDSIAKGDVKPVRQEKLSRQATEEYTSAFKEVFYGKFDDAMSKGENPEHAMYLAMDKVSSFIVSSITQKRGAELDDTAKQDIEEKIFKELNSGLGFMAPYIDQGTSTSNSVVEAVIRNAVGHADIHVSKAAKVDVRQSVEAAVEQQTGLKVLGRHTAKVVQDKGAPQVQGPEGASRG